MGPGRPRDHAPKDHYTVTEAAKLLGITPAAVRGRIERGTLPTKESHHLTEGLETRHYIPKAPVDKEVAEKNLPANRGQIDERTSAVVAKLDDMTLAAKDRLDQVLANQEIMKRGLEEAVRVMSEAAEREKAYQDKVIALIDREAERQAERERQGLPERRSLWRRLLGS